MNTAVIVLLAVLAFYGTSVKAAESCMVYGYVEDYGCDIKMWETMNTTSVKDVALVLRSDNVFSSLGEALAGCPLRPVQIIVYGTLVLFEELEYTKNADLIIKGVYALRDDEFVLPKLRWFSGIVMGSNQVNVDIKSIDIYSCGTRNGDYAIL